MHPGDVPNELKDLSFCEELLIALIHPVISLYQIRGGQYGYKGNVISFSQNVFKFATSLPHPLSSISNLIIVDKKNIDNYTDFIVNRQRLYNAFLWLKENNPFYKCINLNTENLKIQLDYMLIKKMLRHII